MEINLLDLGRIAQEISVETLGACHTKTGIPLEGANSDQLMTVLNLGILVAANLEALLKMGMLPEEKDAMRAFLDQFSEKLAHAQANKIIQHPSTPER